MNADTAKMVADGERRLRDRRAAPQPDPMLALLNLVTADRDRLLRENRSLRAAVAKVARVNELGMRPAREVEAGS